MGIALRMVPSTLFPKSLPLIRINPAGLRGQQAPQVMECRQLHVECRRRIRRTLCIKARPAQENETSFEIFRIEPVVDTGISA